MDQRDERNFGSLEYIKIVEFGFPSKLVLSKVVNVADLRKSLNPSDGLLGSHFNSTNLVCDIRGFMALLRAYSSICWVSV